MGQPHSALELPDSDARQIAVDPRYNVVLEASAGTGKTAVLVNRYVNLVLAGVDPQHILAITFTRKAAAEMRERVVRELARQAEVGGLARPRWAALSERLGELAICTIDAFCLALLSEFPLEADLEPGFALVDDAELGPMRKEAVDRALRRAVPLARNDSSLALALSYLGIRRLRGVLEQLLARRLVAQSVFERVASVADARTAGEAGFRVLARIVAAIEAVSGGVAAFLATGPASHPEFAALAAVLRAFPSPLGSDDGAWRRALERVVAYFLTKEGAARRRPPRGYQAHCPSSDAWRRHGELFEQIAPHVQAEFEWFRRVVGELLVRGVGRLFMLAVEENQQLFEVAGVLDFDGALERALRLLRQMEEFAQSRYRLESRYRHVLVDEFQDTSRAQWELVWALIESWGAGLGVAADDGLPPSIFLVGDRKQSIYGFRDAEVALLDHAAAAIERLRPGDRPRRTISYSFRAVPPLLAFFNDLFSEIVDSEETLNPFRYSVEDRFPVADTAESAAEVLGLIVADELEACAERVAAEILRLLTEGRVRDRHSGTLRAVVPADIAVLFRSRETYRRFEQALLARGIPTYVYKGLGFFETDEVKDLTALVRFLADPASDLRAAAFLRSRVVRLSDVALAELAPHVARAVIGRGAPSVMQRLPEPDRAVLRVTRAAVARWLARVDRVPPAELLDEILRETAYAWELRGPRVRQARENVKKFRALIRRLQNRGYPTVARIATRLGQLALGDESNAVVDAADAVSLMTVHAAKGLEFPIVFVVNLARGTGGRHPSVRLVTDRGDGTPRVGLSDLDGDLQSLERRRDREETKRLLYVAMTRARDRLYLSSTLRQGRLRPAAGSLADVLPESFRATLERAASAADGTLVDWTAASGRVHWLRVCAPPVPPKTIRRLLEPADRERRTDLAQLAPGDVPRVSVTQLASGTLSVCFPEAAAEARSERLLGRLVHRLVERCGLTPPADEALAVEVRRSLPRDEPAATVENLEALLERACAAYKSLCRRPDVIALFGGRCDYEVPFAMRVDPTSSVGGEPVARPTIVRGVIDCLVWKPDGRVVVVELKTGTPRADHERQLAWYVHAVRAWLPDRDVSGVLIYV